MRTRAALGGLLVLALGAAPAAAQDPGRWRGTGYAKIPLAWYQGVTADPGGALYFDGVFTGLYRADTRLRQTAGSDVVIPASVTALEGFNHIGDISWDRREGGRILLPLECFTPGAPNGGNTCGRGAIGVAAPRTLRWRYRVPLDLAEIAKAMWAEVSPDGRLVWTSSGPDLLAYRTADIAPRNAGHLIRAVRRLPGAVPPTGVTGAAFYGERLLLAGQAGGTFAVWSVDLRSGARRLEIQRDMSGESEGLLALDLAGGVLHWIVTPADPLGRPPTYPPPGNVLLHFRPARPRPPLRARAVPDRPPADRRIRVTISARGPRNRPLAGAAVRAGRSWAITSARGTAALSVVLRRGVGRRVTVERPDLRPASLTLRAR